MKKLLLVIFLLACWSLPAQTPIELSFAGQVQEDPCPLDSILVRNLDQSCDTMLVAPDTLFQMVLTAMDEPDRLLAQRMITQNYPNPFLDQTRFELKLAEQGPVLLEVYDIRGTKVAEWTGNLNRGEHGFTFVSGPERTYFVRVMASGKTDGIKMAGSGTRGASCRLTYTDAGSGFLKQSAAVKSGFQFAHGDQLLLVGYSLYGQSGTAIAPESSLLHSFQFATNTPCADADSILFDEQWYYTVQVFDQCWFRENLNAGTQLMAGEEQEDNGIVEKYCMMNSEENCNTYGGMYCWDEMMAHGTSDQQGICPEGWHVPTDLDWKILEGAVDSQYGIGSPEWDGLMWRGQDAGSNLKETGTAHWWTGNTGTDAFSFKAMPGGYFVDNDFWGLGYRAVFWASDPPNYTIRVMDSPDEGVRRNAGANPANEAFYLRCIKDQDF